MKKIILTLTSLLFCVSFLQAQVVLYGLTSGGGNGGGTIIKYQSASNTLEAVHAFDTIEGVNPRGSLLQASDNKLYGMTSNGGANGYGTIFSYDPVLGVFTKLHDFDGINGAEPNGSLIQTSDGKLYGMTTFGGVNNRGTIFSYDPVGATFSKLHDFEFYNGRYPYGSLTQNTDGKLYGITSDGGIYCTRYCGGDGLAFYYNPTDSTFSTVKQLYGFAYPFGSFTLASNGVLYATAGTDGNSACGSTKGGDGSVWGISSDTPAYFTETYLYAGGNNAIGKNPYGDVIEASDGKLYGMTSGGGSKSQCGGPYGDGIIFSYDTASKVITDKHDFISTDGSSPYGSLMQASDGKMYGMTSAGGSNNFGVIFSYNLNGSVYTKLKDFTGANGAAPWYGKLIEVKSCTVPVIKTDSISSVCAGSSLMLHTTGGQIYSWAGPGGFASTKQNPVIDSVTAAAAGMYKVTVSNGAGCTATDSTLVKVNALPMVSIPDASALRMGVDPNTVYIGFSPAEYITLTASVKNKSGNLTYAWSTGQKAASIRVNPTVATTYSVVVTDTFGCSQKAVKTVKVQDVRCGNKLNKVQICRASFGKNDKVKEKCVDTFSAFIELLFGAHLGGCNTANNNTRIGIADKTTDEITDKLTMKVSPNPTNNYFKIDVKGNNTKNEIYIRVLDKVGRLMEVMSVKDSQTLTIGSSYSRGMYFVEAVQGNERVTLKVIKL